MDEPYHLERFVAAQDADGTYDRAVGELRRGRKRGHWMWFVFPQVTGLGQSQRSKAYAIASLEEARRREWLQRPPEERIAGRLQFWLLQQRAKRREPTPAEVAARRAELLAELAARTAARPAQPGGCPG